MIGFTYNGIHCSTYGVGYIPDASARWRVDAAFDIYQKDIGWKNGGVIYGNSVKIREINVACYFEEISIATREKIRKWLGRNTSGQLIFDDLPFMYYNVTIGDIVQGNIYNDNGGTYSGTFAIKFLAADPFGYLTRKSNDGTENDNAEDYCGIISSSDMPAAPTTSSTAFNIYNPGTEQCGLMIKLKGTCSKCIRILNERNNTRCVINSLPTNSIELRINGDTGNVTVYALGVEDNGFAYHDYGFVRLEPDGDADDSYTGAKIIAGGVYKTCNHIVIQEKTDAGAWVQPTSLVLSSISVDYNPRLL